MAIKKVKKEKGKKKEIYPSITMDINISQLYKIDEKNILHEIDNVKYSNSAYIQVSPRDVYIDFFEMPGILKDGKMIIKGTRIFMTHTSAKKLADTLTGLINQVSKTQGLESMNK